MYALTPHPPSPSSPSALLPLLSRLRHHLLRDLQRAPLEPKYHRVNLAKLCPGALPNGLVSLLRCFGYERSELPEEQRPGISDIMTTGLGHKRYVQLFWLLWVNSCSVT